MPALPIKDQQTSELGSSGLTRLSQGSHTFYQGIFKNLSIMLTEFLWLNVSSLTKMGPHSNSRA